jgi:hypothetical protein
VGAIPMRHLQEFRLVSVDSFEPNQRLVFDEIFKEGDLFDVAGTTIGKGFQGFVLSPSLSLLPFYSSLMLLVYNLLFYSKEKKTFLFEFTWDL